MAIAADYDNLRKLVELKIKAIKANNDELKTTMVTLGIKEELEEFKLIESLIESKIITFLHSIKLKSVAPSGAAKPVK